MARVLDLLETRLEGQIRELTQRTSHWPSDMLSCRRQLWYKWHKTSPSDPPDTTALIKMMMGGAAEMIVTKAFADGTYERQVDVRIHTEGAEYPVHGYIDFVVKEPRAIIEVKSSYGRGVAWVRDHGPKPENLAQVAIYQMAETGARHAHLVYLARDNGYRYEFELGMNEQDGQFMVGGPETGYNRDWLTARVKWIEAAVLDDRAPDREYWVLVKGGEIRDAVQRAGVKYKSDWQCSYCPFLRRCWGPVAEEGGDNLDAYIEAHTGKGDSDEQTA